MDTQTSTPDITEPQPDAKWGDFVNQHSDLAPSPPPQVDDPKWGSLVKSYANPTPQPEAEPTLGESAMKIAQPIMDLAVKQFMPKQPEPQEDQDNQTDADKELNSFRNSKNYLGSQQNFMDLVSNAVIKPAVNAYAQVNSLGPTYEQQVVDSEKQVAESFNQMNHEQTKDEYGNVVPWTIDEAVSRGIDILNPVMGVFNVGLNITGLPALAKTLFTQPLGQLLFPNDRQKAEQFSEETAQGIAMIAAVGEGGHEATPVSVQVRNMRNAGVFDGEDSYFNEPSKTQLHEVTPETTPQSSPFDIHAAARNVAPDTFSAYDPLLAKQEALRGQLTNLSEQRTAALDVQIKEIQDAKSGGYGKLQSLIEKRNDIASQDTPEMTAVRQEIQKNDYAMRDLAPKVSEAYRAASEFATAEHEPEAPQEATPLHSDGVSPSTGAVGKPIEEQRQSIINDISQRLTTAGRPQEEVNAVAQLESARYQTLAEQYPKFSAEEWYNRESANIKAGKEQARVLAQAKEVPSGSPISSIDLFSALGKPELSTTPGIGPRGAASSFEKMSTKPIDLQQPSRGKIRLATKEAKATITLMKNANASTLIHEKGHEWTDQLLRLSAEDDAPAQMKADAETLRKYGGAGEDGVLPTRGHEKIARGFERYLMEGTAPNHELAGVFAKFKQWLTQIYQTVEKLRSPISNDIRDVFDRFLSAKPEKTVLATDHEPGAMLANIHEADARETPPEKAAPVADNIRNEIKSTAKLHGDKEAENAIATAETEGGAGNQPSPESTPENTSPQEPSEVGASGSTTAAEGGTERNKPDSSGAAADESRRATERDAAAAGEPTQSPISPFGKGKSYFIGKEGVINFDLFKTPDDFQRYLQEWADKNPDKINDAVGGVQTLDKVVKLSESTGLTVKDLLNRKVGELYDGPKQVAAAQFFIQMSQKLEAEAKEARASGDPQKILDFMNSLEDRHDFMDIFLQQKGIAAEASRALGARRAIRKLPGYEQAEQVAELFQRMTGVNMKDAKAQADLFASLENPSQISNMAQKTRDADWRDYMIAYRNNNILSGPVTHLHYADGNMINLLYKPLKVAAASLLPGGPKLGEAGAMYNSMVMGAQKGWESAKAAWQDGVDRSFQDTVENYKRPTSVTFNPTFDKYFGKGSPVGRSIGAIHSFFYTMNYQQVKSQLAFREALKEGLEENSDVFNNRVSDLITNPTDGMMVKADADAKESMYLKNPEFNSFLGHFNAIANRTYVGRALLPFAKIEMNVKLLARDNTVLGLFSKDVRADLSGVNGSEARAIRIASMSMGTSLFGLGVAAGDLINGSGPNNPAQRKIWLLTHQPNSIQIGDVSVPLRAMGTPGAILLAAAEIREAFSDAKGSDEHDGLSNNAAAAFMEHVSNVLFEGTFIQNVKSLTDAIFHPAEYGNEFLQNTASGFVPYTSLLGQTNRYIDPFQREVHSQGLANIYGITDYVKSHIPGASLTLQPRVDVLGNPISNDRWFAAGSYDKYVANPAVQKMQSLGMGLTMPKRDILGVQLDDKQYHEFAVTSGVLIQQRLWNTNGYGVLQEHGFDALSHAAKVLEVSGAVKDAREAAKTDMLIRYPQIGTQATVKKTATELR